ncbi:MAG: ribulose bisphosphate carboxylase small subunit [Gammaproteobacteria bacterium]
MQADKQKIGAQSDTDRVLGQIGHCLRRGCVICIEHAPALAPRHTSWELWERPSCYNGDVERIYREFDRCRTTHADHHIRLNIEDHNCYSRFVYVVHSPAAG